eukprot:5017317-Prymnesium_polylepis.3
MSFPKRRNRISMHSSISIVPEQSCSAAARGAAVRHRAPFSRGASIRVRRREWWRRIERPYCLWGGLAPDARNAARAGRRSPGHQHLWTQRAKSGARGAGRERRAARVVVAKHRPCRAS